MRQRVFARSDALMLGVVLGLAGISLLRKLSLQTYIVTNLGAMIGKNASAYAINDQGQIVGEAQMPNGQSHAFLWEQGHMLDLGTLGGTSSQANALNAADEVVGAADTQNQDWHAFRYAQGKIEDIGMANATTSEAYAINDTGQIAGTAQNANIEDYAWLATAPGKQITNLLAASNGPWKLQQVLGMNNKGQIVALGYAHGHSSALLLSPP